MSEFINNREYRKKVLKQLIMELHEGKKLEEVKPKFEETFSGIAATEIAEIEQEIIMEGMPIEEVQRLCDVHASIYKGNIEDIHRPADRIPGHPVHTFKLENRALEKHISEVVEPQLEVFYQDNSDENTYKLIEDLNLLLDIDKHYSRKENLLFPYLEKYGITAPPKVMWGVDDEIRNEIKAVKGLLHKFSDNKDEIVDKCKVVLEKIKEMIFKEESILFPMALDTLTEDEWFNIMRESDEIGHCLVEPEGIWVPDRVDIAKEEEEDGNQIANGYIKFETGILTAKEISTIFNNLPFDITFIDENDVVKYFSHGKERIFARTKSVIGRTVQNCHPPGSVHIVEKMLEDFKSGAKDHEDFWIKMGNMFIYIRYFAVKDKEGQYMGTIEVTQNIKPIQELDGEKRLLTE
ncbi:hypothetical protein SAMN05446037_1006240 [Anaerovirgula multivorans]|uniref:PAC domain-containing protein n=1 Tax=Anaerovirgula multivorans TaxID=312168 RepID=A0A239D199_9FIRM|nr:DUF438 domain-containing protein [Anaerovirgula multivorans]SNS25383.1 hypothetical protein SAMN05446037_1006240 [Anaerovirgula multivorans]